MSLFKELERHGEQGWAYSSSYDRSNTGVFNNSSVDNWPSPVSQPCALSGVSTPGSADSCVQEIKSSDTDSEDVLLVDDPGVVRVPVTPSRQGHPGQSVYQNSFGSHSPHSLPHSGHAQPHLLQQLHSPVTFHSQAQSGYFQQHHAAVRPKQQMQLPLNIVLDHGMHTHHKDLQQHGSHLRTALLEHPAQQQQSNSQALHVQGNMPTDSSHQQQQNSRVDHPHHTHRDQQYLQDTYVEHIPQRQAGTNSHPVHSTHPVMGQALSHLHSHSSGAHQRHSMTGLEQGAHPHSTFGKQQMVTLPHATSRGGGGGVHPHSEQKLRGEQEKVVRPDSFVSHGDYQQHGSSFSQHHSAHHAANALGVRQNLATSTTDSGSPSCGVDSSSNEVYHVQSGNKLKLNTVYHLTDKKTGAARVATWDGKRMVPATSNSMVVQQSPVAGDAWDVSQAHTAETGQGQDQGRDAYNNMGGLHAAPNHQRPEQAGASASVVNSQSAVSGATVLPIQDNSVSAGINQPAKPFPRLSATNEVWPTPMPSRKSTNAESAKETRAQSPDSLPDLTDLSAPQSSVDPPVIEVSPPQQNYKEPKAQTAPPQEQPNTHVPQTSNTAEPESNSARIKRKLKEDEEAYAVCRYCGYTSTNVDYCEGCQRKLPMDVKVCIKKRRSAGDGSDLFPGSGDEKAENLPGAVDKKSFYGNKLKTQAAAFKNKISEFAKEFDVKPKKPQRGRKPGTTPRNIGRGRKIREMLEPVTVILSSDEDEVSKTDGTPQQQSSNTSGSISVTSQHDDDEMPFFPAQSAKPTAFGKSRRERMQDEAGRCVSAKNPMVTDGLQVVQPNRNLIEVRGVRVGSMRSSGHTVDLMPNVIHFDVNSDRTGEDLQFEVFLAEVEWIKFTLSQMQPVCFIKVSPACGSRLRERLKMSLQTQEYFDPGSQDPKKSLIVVIIETILNEDGLRKRLSDYKKMHSGVPGFLEELDFDEANNMLVKSTPPVLNNVESSHQLRRFHKQKNSCQATSSPSTISIPSSQCSGDFGDSSVLEDSMDMGMVAQTAGDAGAESPCSSNKEEPMPSRSPSPKIGFVGPVEKLLTYPPPPAKGGITITNEDLYCLNEGEFLNDVILDFYLKYLFREKLSEEDRQRTHIFSSFFYKRLMQRQSRSLQDAEDVKLTPAQRRHSRVKTWTRHVDIFEKDFLLIPINEHSHWFLAVICFPGLEKQERQMFEPAGPSLDESLNDSSNENGNIKLSASPSWQEDTASPAVDESKEEPMDTGDAPSSKAILGSVIQNHEESKSFTTGVKQACILILDSLAGPSRNGIIKILKEYLQIEWDLKKKTPRTVTKTVRGGVPRVPQQTNYSDCGVFVLQYAESFFENPVCDFSIPMKGLSKWFPLSKVQKKRDEIRKLILDLHGEAS